MAFISDLIVTLYLWLVENNGNINNRVTSEKWSQNDFWAFNSQKPTQDQFSLQQRVYQSFFFLLLGDKNESVNKLAERVLLRLEQKLQGIEDGVQLSVSGQVNLLIQESRDPKNLSRLFPGWQPYIWKITTWRKKKLYIQLHNIVVIFTCYEFVMVVQM